MYKVDITGQGESGFKVSSDGHEIVLDPKGGGISPSAALLASIGSCVGVYLRKYCKGANLELKDFKISVEADFVKEPVFCFKEINVSVDLKGLQLEERRQQALLNFAKKCPIHNTLKSDPQINLKLLNSDQ
ncbi:OsmC family protein [Candidatus Omnitrophota bacterium]